MELSAIMKTMGMKLTTKELDQMMKSVDEDGSGEIDFKEFCQLLGFEWSDEFAIDLKEIDERRTGGKEKEQKQKQGFSEVGDNVIQGFGAPSGTFLTSDAGGATMVCFSPCGKLFGVCSVDEHVTIYEVSHPRLLLDIS